MKTWKNESEHAHLEYEGAVTFVGIGYEISLMSEADKRLAREIIKNGQQ